MFVIINLTKQIKNPIIPFLHVFPSFLNANPSSQAHLYLCFLLLQIWLQPPLLAVSQGCTKYRVIIQLEWQLYYYGIRLQLCNYKCDNVYIFPSPLLQVRLSFPNTNPSSQAHSYLCFVLLQIWLQPPLLSLSQGCTEK